jgi:hypothetical protein
MTTRTPAVGAVNSTLRSLVRSAVDDADLGAVRIISAPRELSGAEADSSFHRATIGVILYRIAGAAAPRVDPTAASRRGRSLSLDLHYLLTAESSVADVAEGLLASAMATLHLNPVLSVPPVAQDIGTGTGADPASDPGPLILHIAEETLAISELASLWSAFGVRWQLAHGYVVHGLTLQNAPTRQ